MARMWNYGRQHPPKLKLLLILEQSLNWGSVDQELHQCLLPCRYLVHSILLFLSILMKSWLIPKVLEDGAYLFFIPRSWAVVGLNKLHRNVPCYLFRFPAWIFLQEAFCQKRFRFPNGTLESLEVYDPHLWSRYLTMFFLPLKLICGVMGRKMFAYLDYLYCSAEGWSMPGLVLSQIQVSWNMGYLEGMKERSG